MKNMMALKIDRMMNKQRRAKSTVKFNPSFWVHSQSDDDSIEMD